MRADNADILVMLGLLMIGGALIWVAGLLTVMTGADYLVKAMPYLRDRNR